MDNTPVVPSKNPEGLRESIRKTLAHRAGKSPDASIVAGATISIWNEISTLLEPVFGRRGVYVIFRRSLYLASKDFALLALNEDTEDNSALLANLNARLASQDTENAATEASYILLVTFTELLTTLIGEPLTERLLHSVWASEPASSTQGIPA
jgi:hypothetical protein